MHGLCRANGTAAAANGSQKSESTGGDVFDDILRRHGSNAQKLALRTLAVPTSLPLPHACDKAHGKPGPAMPGAAEQGGKVQKGYTGSVQFHSAAGRSLAAQRVA